MISALSDKEIMRSATFILLSANALIWTSLKFCCLSEPLKEKVGNSVLKIIYTLSKKSNTEPHKFLIYKCS